MNETEMQDELMALVAENGEGVHDVRSFADDGVLSSNKGLVIYREDGSVFQVTIVRSGAPDETEDDEEV